jgi:hypothetical protein
MLRDWNETEDHESSCRRLMPQSNSGTVEDTNALIGGVLDIEFWLRKQEAKREAEVGRRAVMVFIVLLSMPSFLVLTPDTVFKFEEMVCDCFGSSTRDVWTSDLMPYTQYSHHSLLHRLPSHKYLIL